MADETQSYLDTSKKPKVEASDEDLVALSTKWLKEAESYRGELERVWQRNEAYYLGNQTERGLVPVFSSDAVQNHIFMGTETIVPIITSNTPQFLVSPQNEDELSAKLSDAIEKILTVQYEEQDIRAKIEKAVRHMVI